MKMLGWILWTLYGFKFVIIFSWIAHSVYLMRFPRNLNVLWNIISSIFLLMLDVYAHAIYCCRSRLDRRVLIGLCGVFFFFVGPVLLGLSLFGSLTDSINYDQEFCRRGCALSIFFRDFHSVLLYIVSIFGIGVGFWFVVSISCLNVKIENMLGINQKQSQLKNRTRSSLHYPLIDEGAAYPPDERIKLYALRALSE